MFPSPQGQWVPTLYPYVSPVPSRRKTAGPPLFVGRRPTSACFSRDQISCESDPSCRWITTAQGSYCRGLPGSVSGKYPQQVRYQPRYKGGASPCFGLPQDACNQTQCRWIQNSQGANYCSGLPGTARPYSTTRPVGEIKRLRSSASLARMDGKLNPEEIEQTLFSNGQFQPYRWSSLSSEIKNQIYTQEGQRLMQERAKEVCSSVPAENREECEKGVVDMLQKYCRCMFEQPTQEIFRYGEIRSAPYAICNARVAGSHKWLTDLSGGRLSPSTLRSILSQWARQRMCTGTLDLQRIPTSFLYGLAVNHLGTSKGRAAFAHTLPSLDTFLEDRQKWRSDLIRLIDDYRNDHQD
jgi:hypothetical protein